MIKAGIIGATGYAGVELVRILLTHPEAELTAVSSVSFEGQTLSDIYPSLRGIADLILGDADEVIQKCDVVFAAVPAGISEDIARKCVQNGTVLIDLGADFRLEDPQVYETWYGKTAPEEALLSRAVYGLSELFADKIAATDIIANPGCYPTSVALGLAPALCNGLVSADRIVIDSKSGVTGAGRKLTQNTHYAELNEGFGPYKIAAHRHTPEIEQTLSILAGKAARVTFVPHLLPVNRGIISTVYADLCEGVTLEQVYNAYQKMYENMPFVRLLPLGKTANLHDVRCSNYCDISLHADEHAGKLIVVSTIDNMVKGAAGQAVQNMNIRFGLKQTCGLMMIPPAF
ncbi:MAG: N-acetyl-gamma-glutamyl-phosphate reductase [Clostridia bacterium]|nr:N-acetyl-gamma-glutamyl-phosphate reductase [Clostridia bacterium]